MGRTMTRRKPTKKPAAKRRTIATTTEGDGQAAFDRRIGALERELRSLRETVAGLGEAVLELRPRLRTEGGLVSLNALDDKGRPHDVTIAAAGSVARED